MNNIKIRGELINLDNVFHIELMDSTIQIQSTKTNKEYWFAQKSDAKVAFERIERLMEAIDISSDYYDKQMRGRKLRGYVGDE